MRDEFASGRVPLSLVVRSFVLLGVLLVAGCRKESHGCNAGAEGCLCGPLDACDDGLVCASQHCVPAIERALRIDAPGSRARELGLADGTRALAGGSRLGGERAVPKPLPAPLI